MRVIRNGCVLTSPRCISMVVTGTLELDEEERSIIVNCFIETTVTVRGNAVSVGVAVHDHTGCDHLILHIVLLMMTIRVCGLAGLAARTEAVAEDGAGAVHARVAGRLHTGSRGDSGASRSRPYHPQTHIHCPSTLSLIFFSEARLRDWWLTRHMPLCVCCAASCSAQRSCKYIVKAQQPQVEQLVWQLYERAMARDGGLYGRGVSSGGRRHHPATGGRAQPSVADSLDWRVLTLRCDVSCPWACCLLVCLDAVDRGCSRN